jgi:hypothetical protein
MRATPSALDAHARSGRRAPWAAFFVALACVAGTLPATRFGEGARAFAATGFDLTLVRPAQTSGAFLQQGDPRVRDANTWTIGLYQQLTLAPLVLREPIGGRTENAFVSQRLESTLVGLWTPFRRLSVGASLAGVPWQGGAQPDVPLAGASNHPAPHALGDVGLAAKVGLLPEPDGPGLHLALAADVFLPSGASAAYAGAGAWRAKTRLLVGYDGRAGSLALGLGFDRVPRADVPLAGILLDDLWTVGAAGAWHVRPGVTAFAEAQASVLFETAQRLYPRGIRAALAQAPAYALLGARVAVAARYGAVFAVWKGLDAAPGAASLGLLAAVEGRWGGNERAEDAPLPKSPGRPPGEARDAEREADTEADPGATHALADTAEAESEGERDREGRAPGPAEPTPPSRPSTRSLAPMPRTRLGDGTRAGADADQAKPSSLAAREGDALVLAEPLPWQGHTAKLAAASVPILRAIADVLKQESTPTSTRLVLAIEAVGTKPKDLALARRRATALQGVLAHLGRWAKKRITAKGVVGRAGSTDVTRPALTLTFLPASLDRATDRGVSEPATATPPAPADAPDEAGDVAQPPVPPQPGVLAWKNDDQILLARPLPWQGRTAKLAAASIPLLRALAATLKEEPASATLAIEVAPTGPGHAEVVRARARAVALRGVLAHLAHWPVRRITAAAGEVANVDADVTTPALSLRLNVGAPVHLKAIGKRRGRH